MAKFTRRIFIRRYLKTPIEVQGHKHNESRPATAFDCCKDGMHFICDDYIGPGSIIFIRPCDGLNPFLDDAPETAVRARVVWCRRCARKNLQGFSIGVQFTPEDRNGHRPEY